MTMKPSTLRYYVHEVGLQASIAKRVWPEIGVALQLRPDAHGLYPIPFSPAQAFLTSVAQISKLFWAPGGQKWSPERRAFADARGRALREALQPRDVLHSRAVRNGIEHYDARLDDILFENEEANPVGLLVGDRDGITRPIIRLFDVEAGKLAVVDDEANLFELTEAVAEVDRKAVGWMRGHGFPLA